MKAGVKVGWEGACSSLATPDVESAACDLRDVDIGSAQQAQMVGSRSGLAQTWLGDGHAQRSRRA